MTTSQETKYLKDFRSLMVKYFNSDELRHIVFDLGIDWEELEGNVRSIKVQNLILKLARYGRLDELREITIKQRPKIQWPEIPSPEQQTLDELANIPDSERESALQEYINKMNEFIINPSLMNKPQYSSKASAWTSSLIRRLDKDRLVIVLRFLSDAKFNMEFFNFSDIDLSEANLNNINLAGLNLSKANLSNANLVKVNLSETNLFHSNFQNANLQEANFHKANLNFTNLKNANLQEAIFGEANINNTDFEGAKLNGVKFYKHSFDIFGDFKSFMNKNIKTSLRSTFNFIRLDKQNWVSAFHDSIKSKSIKPSKDAYASYSENFFNDFLDGTDLSNVDVQMVDLTGAIYCIKTKWPEGFDPIKKGAILITHSNAGEIGL